MALAELARRVGIAKPTLYHYFPSKDDLLRALFHEVCRAAAFPATFAWATYTPGNFLDRLAEDGAASIEEQQRHPMFSRVLHEYFALGLRDPRYADALRDLVRGYHDGFRDLLRHGVQLGALPPLDVNTHAAWLAFTFDGLSNAVLMGLDIDIRPLWTQQVRRLLTP